ncbi:acyl carrier protein [Oryzobacter telluris]|uniref:acyl carrier protein n=1 Tax=Oryzobacter telluris TaxID=3149179 RepID=UPI00370D4A4A
MTRSEILATVREELAVAAPDVPADADTAAHFGVDLGVDSLAVLEFVARLEYRYGIAVPDDAWPGLTSMDAVADHLHGALVTAS